MEMTELTRSAGIDGHEQRVVFRGGANGTPQAMWENPEVQALIKEQLNDGAVDIVVLICCSEELSQTDFQRDQAIVDIVDYALARNPETRFRLAMPWSRSPHTYATAADHRAGTDAAYPRYQLLAESVSAASGGAEVSAFYHGAAVYEIRSRFENGLIPELTALIGPLSSSVFTDETGHAGSMAKDAGALIWLNALYEINPLDLPRMNAYDVDIRAIAAAALSATGETTPPPAATTSANVYWRSTVAHPHGSPDRITAGTRNVNTRTPIRSSLEALFAGTNVAEQVTGMATSVPAGTQVLGISRSGTTATINLTAEFASPASPLDATTRLAQVVFTVTQFDGIDQVQFHIDGTPVDPIFSLAVDQGLTRNSFNDDVRAYIMVEQPAPEAQTTNPLVISGEANTFEATVRYAVTNDNGDLLIEGFTTAAIYNFGTWGAFEVTIDAADFPAGYQHGPGKITLWEDNSGDEGPDRINVVEVPVILPER